MLIRKKSHVFMFVAIFNCVFSIQADMQGNNLVGMTAFVAIIGSVMCVQQVKLYQKQCLKNQQDRQALPKAIFSREDYLYFFKKAEEVRLQEERYCRLQQENHRKLLQAARARQSINHYSTKSPGLQSKGEKQGCNTLNQEKLSGIADTHNKQYGNLDFKVKNRLEVDEKQSQLLSSQRLSDSMSRRVQVSMNHLKSLQEKLQICQKKLAHAKDTLDKMKNNQDIEIKEAILKASPSTNLAAGYINWHSIIASVTWLTPKVEKYYKNIIKHLELEEFRLFAKIKEK